MEYGGKAEEFASAISNFERLVKEKGVNVKPTLIESGLMYYLAAKIAKEEFVLPVIPGSYYTDTDYSKLIPAEEIINKLKEIQNNS